MIIRLQSTHAPVAQLDRVSDSDSEGHRFESCRAYHPSHIRTTGCASIKAIGSSDGFYCTFTQRERIANLL